MSNLREVNDDILKDWLLFREDEISEKILRNIPKQNRSYVQKQLNILDDNFMDYIGYWNEKYYRNGFCDGVQLFKVDLG